MPYTHTRAGRAAALAAALLAACSGGGAPDQIETPPTLKLSVTPSTIAAGQSATVNWSTTNATSCSATGAWSGAQPSQGHLTVSPNSPGASTFTLDCMGPGGHSSQSTVLTVSPGIALGVAPATIGVSQAASLTWSAPGLSACSASGAWNGSQAITGTLQVLPAVPGSYTYTLSCSVPGGGSISQTAILAVTPLVTLNAATASLQLGQGTLLTWSATGATACSATGVWSGPEKTTGTLPIQPDATGIYTYNLTCTGGGQSASQQVLVQVSPALDLSVSPASIPAGQNAMLNWSSRGAVGCTATNAWIGGQLTSGTALTAPTNPGTYVYTLQCADAGARATMLAAVLTVMPAGYAQSSLVADRSGTPAHVDANLKDPWGIAMTSSFAVAANRLSSTSSGYDGAGTAGLTQPIDLPPTAAGTAFAPTGIVTNSATNEFLVSSPSSSAGPSSSASATLIYAGVSGQIAGWSAAVDAAHALTVYTDSSGAVYTGLALANNGSGDFLYAADFRNNKIDVLDSTFKKQTPSATQFAFADPALPSGYAPFGIQALKSGASVLLYVAYAKPLAAASNEPLTGAGLGLVNVFDANGKLVTHLIPAGSTLNVPWGMALTPARNFGALTGALLVSNLGDGALRAFNISTGVSLAAPADASGTPLTIAGIRGIAFGNGRANQPISTLFFTASADAQGGEYGRIDFGAAPRLHAPPTGTLRSYTRGRCAPFFCPPGYPYETEAVVFNIQDSSGIAWVDFSSGGTYVRTINAAPYSSLLRYSRSIDATITDVDGNIVTLGP
jgi:uncharacterized protein (TIGR03118 family)